MDRTARFHISFSGHRGLDISCHIAITPNVLFSCAAANLTFQLKLATPNRTATTKAPTKSTDRAGVKDSGNNAGGI